MSDGNVKLIDFGFAKRINEKGPQSSVHFVAPEALKGSYTTQSDVWSLGVVLKILLLGKPLFDGSYKVVKEKIVNERIEFMGQISPDAKDLLINLL